MTEYTGLDEAVREIVSCIVTQVEDNHAKHLTEELRLQSRKLDDYAATILEQAKKIAELKRMLQRKSDELNVLSGSIAAYHAEVHESHITKLEAENVKLREALIDTTASLVASVSLLERGGKKAAPSDKMFAQMLVDYKNSIDRARAAFEGVTEPQQSGAGNHERV